MQRLRNTFTEGRWKHLQWLGWKNVTPKRLDWWFKMYLQVLLKANRKDLRHGGSCLLFPRSLSNYCLLLSQTRAGQLRELDASRSRELGVSLELDGLSEWSYFLDLTLFTGGLAPGNDWLPLHRLPEPAMAVEAGRRREHPGNGSALNGADGYTGTIR